MYRKSFFGFVAAGLSAMPVAALAENAAPPQQSALANAYMEALIQKCLDNGALLPTEVQAMTDEELSAALTECAKTQPGSTQQAAAPVVQERAPVVVRRRPKVIIQEEPTFIETAPSQGSGGVIKEILEAASTSGGDGGFDPSANVDPLDARIESLESGIKEGIGTSALTANEAAILNARLAEIQTTRANLGDTPASRLIVQRQVNAAIADFNRKVHNNAGIPNPDLFRKRKHKGEEIANGKTPKFDRMALARARAAAAANKGQQKADQSSFNRFELMKKRREAREAASAAVQPNKIRCVRAPCGPSFEPKKVENKKFERNNVFVQQRIERIKKRNAGNGNTTSAVTKEPKKVFPAQTTETRKANARNIMIHRNAAKSDASTTNNRRRVAQRSLVR